MRIDARVPLVFGPVEAQSDDHVLTEGVDFEARPAAAATHVPDCACCGAGRGAVGGLLGGLFFARARGTVPFFRRVVVRVATDEGRAMVVDALADDPVASGCYRPG